MYRYQPGMVYDAAHRMTVLFGGVNGVQGLFGDTWGWDGSSWKLLSKKGPSPRSVPNMAYDSSRRRVVLFGGYLGPNLDAETWEWNGLRWRLVSKKGPSARDGSGMAYDSRRRRVVMFGGSTVSGNRGSSRETWEWNSRRWRRVSTSGPSPRMYCHMAYDPVRRVTVLFGGCNDEGKIYSDTWTWNGRVWREVSSSGSKPRVEHGMVYDSKRRGIVMFGGVTLPEPAPDAGSTLAEMELWDGKGWKPIGPFAGVPGPRRAPGMSYDTGRKVIVLFGGEEPNRSHRFLGDTWEWTP